LRHVQDVHQKHHHQLSALPEDDSRHNRPCELNVIEQVSNISQTTTVLDAWKRGQALTVHGWIYGIRDGLLRDLNLSLSAPADLKEKYLTAAQDGHQPFPLD